MAVLTFKFPSFRVFPGDSVVKNLPANAGAAVAAKLLSCIRLCATSWTVAHQASLSMGFSSQEYWNGQPFPSPVSAGDLGSFPGWKRCPG